MKQKITLDLILDIFTNRIWVIHNEICRILLQPLVWALLKHKGVEIVAPFKFYGMPVFLKYKGSKIVIGENFENRNTLTSNPLAIDHPTVFCTLDEKASIILGKHVGISGGNICAATQVTVGDYTMIGSNCVIIDTDFHPTEIKNRRYSTQNIKSSPINIGKNVFIGTRCTILRGVKIGDNTIVGAGSVVRKNIPKNSIYVDGQVRSLKK